MYTLKNWSFGKFIDGGIYVNGTVYGHHRLQDGHYICTSEIEKIYLCADNEYVAETHSGSLYHLFVDEMDPEKDEDTKEKLGLFKLLDGAEAASQLAAAKEVFDQKQKIIGAAEDTAKEYMDEDGLYLIMEYMHVVKAILKKDTNFREIHASVHAGMFQDSVLVTDWEDGKVDFRYFPNYMMEPYHWSDGLSCIYIHNIGKCSIVFKGTKQNIECKANEVTKISKDEYQGEALFSPDAVNGKCVFSNAFIEGDEEANGERITQEEINRLLGGE